MPASRVALLAHSFLISSSRMSAEGGVFLVCGSLAATGGFGGSFDLEWALYFTGSVSSSSSSICSPFSASSFSSVVMVMVVCSCSPSSSASSFSNFFEVVVVLGEDNVFWTSGACPSNRSPCATRSRKGTTTAKIHACSTKRVRIVGYNPTCCHTKKVLVLTSPKPVKFLT